MHILDSTYKSYKSTQSNMTSRSKNTGRSNYVSRYATRSRKEKSKPPNPAKINFEFTSYERDDDLREMTEIPEEPLERKPETAEEAKRRREEAMKRGQEVITFIQKEMVEIDKCK